MLGKSYSNASAGNCAAIAANASPVSYSYDQGPNGIGQRTGMSDASGSVSWSYDARGRLVSDGSFASAWGYNSADGLAWRQYPGGNNGQLGELISYSYDQRMQLTTAAGDYDYVSASAYDAAGRLVQRSLGNAAVLSQYSYYPWEQQGGRLQQLLSGTPADSDSLQDLRYSYDLSGNLLSLQDYLAGAPQTQSFAYDALDRLVSAAASGGDNGLGDYSLEMAYDHGSVSLASSGHLRQKGELLYLYGDSGHTHAVTAASDGYRYEYDPNGNLVRKVSQPWSLLDLYLPVVMSSLPEETLDSPPEPPESQSAPVSPYPPPEEQSRVQASGLLAWLHSAWDFLVNWFDGGTQTAQAAGLLQAYPPPGDPTPTATSTPVPTPTSTPTPTATPDPLEEILYTYDAENRLVSVSSGEVQASFMYDGDGQRVVSLIDGSVTVYIGEIFEWEVASGSMRRYYYAGAQWVALRTGSAAPVWLLGDHLGSTSVAANTDGSLFSRQGYLPCVSACRPAIPPAALSDKKVIQYLYDE